MTSALQADPAAAAKLGASISERPVTAEGLNAVKDRLQALDMCPHLFMLAALRYSNALPIML